MSQKQTNGRLITNNGNLEDNVDENNGCCWEIKSLTSLPSSPPGSTLSKLNSLDCWDYTIELECLQGPQDLQLAAELGKTLLERNKELESSVKHYQNLIEDQGQEIEYLQKQTAALREVNDSRLRIYEQLEVSIQDLERQNHRLAVENASEKKQNKTLCINFENLEARFDELSKNFDEIKKELDLERRKTERIQQDRINQSEQSVKKLRPVQNYVSSNHDSDNNEAAVQNGSEHDSFSFAFQSPKGKNSTGTDLETSFDISQIAKEENEEMINLINELENKNRALLTEQQRVTELEEQLVAIIQENQTLQSKVVQANTNEEMKSVHEELSILEEVRQGTMCSRCLRSVDDRNNLEDGSSIMGTEDDDDRSLMELINAPDQSQIFRSALEIKPSPNSIMLDLNSSNTNPYRELVEKYEALLEVQRHPIMRNIRQHQHQAQASASLHEEFQTSGEYSSMNTKGTDEEPDTNHTKDNLQIHLHSNNISLQNNNNNNNGGSSNGIIIGGGNSKLQQQQQRKNCRRTPTDFSEAETSSSGFSDETSNKGTQTDERQGYFLCTIGDGEDCKFSIYGDASPIDSRFRNRPEYRELFKEIFAVLRKAAENKEEGENLPLLDDTHPIPAVSKVPPVTPANEELPDICDDTQSIISSVVSEQSVAMSECITKTERKTAAKKHIVEKNQENRPPSSSSPATSSSVTAGGGGSSHHHHNIAGGTMSSLSNGGSGKHILEDGRVLTPLKREPLEFLSVSLGVKKKNRKKNRNLNSERSDSPVLPSPPRILYSSGKKRRDYRPFNSSSLVSSNNAQASSEWNGNSMIIQNRYMQSPTPSLTNCSFKSRSSGGSTTAACSGGSGHHHGGSASGGGGGDIDMSCVHFKPSTASQDLHKLKKLDLSYAEVLRRADACKHHHRRK